MAAAILGGAVVTWASATQDVPGKAPDFMPPATSSAASERVITIAKPNWPFGSTPLQVTLFTPPGNGPFPLAVINHGKPPGKPADMPRARFPAQSAEFLRRGYMVALPMREGFGKSGGWYYGGSCNIGRNGLVQAEDIDVAIEQLRKLPEVDDERILVIGQSHGGLATMALGVRPPSGVRGLVNFAGGLKIEQCPDWPEQLEQAFALYARKARESLADLAPSSALVRQGASPTGTIGPVPTLWFYGSNDSHWPPALIERLERRYREAGGRVRRIEVGAFGDDAHLLFGDAQGNALWLPELGLFAQSVGLPWPALPPSFSAQPARRTDPAVAAKSGDAGIDHLPARTSSPNGVR